MTRITIYKKHLDLSKQPLGSDVDFSKLKGKLVGSEICDDFDTDGPVPCCDTKPSKKEPKKTMRFDIELSKGKDNYDILKEAMK